MPDSCRLSPARRAAVAAVPALILLVDVAIRRHPPRAIEAILDEIAHAATALLALHALHPRAARRTGTAVGLAAILIDADHVPLEFFGRYFLTQGTGRPYAHSLLGVAACLILAVRAPARRRAIAAALAFGVATHLLRDAATGGVPLLWPVTRAAVRLPYPAYVAVLIGAAGAVALRGARTGPPG